MQLLPHDDKFFDLLVDHAKLALEASKTLPDCLEGGSKPQGARDAAQNIRDLERKGDEALRKIYRRLHKTFITPIDPEDIHQLATLIDEVIDHIDAAAFRFEAFGVNGSYNDVASVASMVNGCVEAMVDAVQVLQRTGVKDAAELTRRCEEINRRELDTENRVREIVRNLFEAERDPIQLIKKKEIFELLETTADCCEDVADVLEGIAVKNS
jgi:uncharacterized protein